MSENTARTTDPIWDSRNSDEPEEQALKDRENEIDNDWMAAIQQLDWGGEISLAEGNEIAADARSEVVDSIHEQFVKQQQRAIKSETELEQKTKEFAIIVGDLQSAQDGLERVQKQAATLKDALRWMLNVVDLDSMNAKHPGSYGRMMDVLYGAHEVGLDYVHREKVKPLVDALEDLLAHRMADKDGNHVAWVGETTFCVAEKALKEWKGVVQ